ncbi:MAG TPA: O-antigen ligase family protein [Planctomycetota bacterium]|nr:O-antigen ligase family protein [Planctomycetota bacterium]
MPGLSATPRTARLLHYTGLLLVTLAPLLYGCQPPWASGFLLSAILLLGAAVVVQKTLRAEMLPGFPPALTALSLALLLWLSITVVYGARVEDSERAPALGAAKLLYAFAFFAAAMVGASGDGSSDSRRHVLGALTILGAILGVFALLQLGGWDVKTLAGWSASQQRPSGLYTNANRFAVLMTLCWFSGLALIVNEFQSKNNAATRRIALPLVSTLLTSACVALTLSRLTIIVTAVVVLALSLVWLLCERAQRQREAASGTFESGQSRILLAAPLVIVAAWLAWCFVIGSVDLRGRFASMNPDLSSEGRFLAVQSALPLIKTELLWGHGLGSFETLFTSVQPAALPGRWRELHCDWLQLAIEAGAPAAALAFLLAVAWAVSTWKASRSSDNLRPDLTRLLPAAGIAVFLLCSIADFPLREPASAVLVFFLAGLLCTRPQDAAAPTAQASGFIRSGALVLAPLLLAAAFISGRNALAYAQSPWFGSLNPPAASASQYEQWRVAVERGGNDPELNFRFASSALAASSSNRVALGEAKEAVVRARMLSPRDHRFPWLEAAITERLGNKLEAGALRERAVMLSPNNPVLREQNGYFYLNSITGYLPGEPERAMAIERCLFHFRAVLRLNPAREPELLTGMENAGCLNTEIAQLWPGAEPPARLRRARFFADRRQWDRAERELPIQALTDVTERAWQLSITAVLALRRGETETGVKTLREALQLIPDDQRSDFTPWLTAQLAELSLAQCVSLTGALLPELFKYPVLSSSLATRLMGAQQWALADQLLEKIAGQSPEFGAQWAELALEMGDLSAASRRARAAWELGLSLPRWGDWYASFQERIKLRK